jgi:hypothetical protein
MHGISTGIKKPLKISLQGLDRQVGGTVVSACYRETGEILSGFSADLNRSLQPSQAGCKFRRTGCHLAFQFGLNVLRTLKNQTGVMRGLAPSVMALPIPCFMGFRGRFAQASPSVIYPVL